MEASSAVRTLRAIPASVVKGFSEWQTLLVLLWLTLLSAAIAVAPDVGLLFKYYGHAPLAEGKPLLSPELLLGISQAYPPGASPLRALGIALLLALPLTLFVTGGVVWRSWTVDRFRLTDFITECARGFGRMVRTLLWSLLLLAVCAGVVVGTSALLHVLHRETVFSAPWTWWVTDRPLSSGWAVLHLLLTVALWALWRLTLDTARVLVLVEELRKTRKALWRSFRLVLRSPGAWAGYALLGVGEAVAVLVMVRIHAALPEGNTGLAWLAIFVAQLVVLVRSGFQVSTTAFAAELVRSTRDAAVAPVGFAAPAKEPAPAPSVAPAVAAETAASEGEPFELLTSKQPPRTGSTSEMPLVDADLVEEDPRGGGSGKR
jgi:hypothetical protein